jgi:hypothetical protein
MAEAIRQRGRPATKPCGTEAAYRRHLRNGEPPCDRCRAAHRAETDKHRPPSGSPLRQERDRYRAALMEIVSQHSPGFCAPEMHIEHLGEIAKKALRGDR